MEHLRAQRFGVENPLDAVGAFGRNRPVFKRSGGVKNTVDGAEIVSAIRYHRRHCLTIRHVGPEHQNLGTAILAGNQLTNDTHLIRAVSACSKRAPGRFGRQCPTTDQSQPGVHRSSQEARKVESDVPQPT